MILIYHRVGRQASIEMDLSADLFAAQLEWLASHVEVLSLGEALGRLDGEPAASTGPAVVVTFDDGTADFADVVVPLLARHRIPATLYLTTAHIEERRPFPHDGVPLSWAALRDCVDTGLVRVGSHTHTHALLDRLDEAATEDELQRSVDLIGERLGTSADDFAYPKAVLGNAAAQRAVRRRFRSAALAGNRPNPAGSTDPYRLQRTAVQQADGLGWFVKKAAGGLAFEDSLRQVLNRRRYARVSR